MKQTNAHGQALLLLLLSMGAILTVVLSVASRSITDVSITSKDEESLRAFSAAEAGVEQVLLTPIQEGTPVTTRVDTTTLAQYEAVVTPYTPNAAGYVYPVGIASGDGGTIWFVRHDSSDQIDDNCNGNNCYKGDTIDVCWGRPGSPAAAIEVSVLYETGAGAIEVGRRVYDPDNVRRQSNRFSAPSVNTTCVIDGRTFSNRTQVVFGTLSNNLTAPVRNGNGNMKFMRVRLLYNTTEEFFGVTALARSLPVQGKLVESTGTAGTSSRKVQVLNLYPEMPSIFDAALFSQTAVTK